MAAPHSIWNSAVFDPTDMYQKKAFLASPYCMQQAKYGTSFYDVVKIDLGFLFPSFCDFCWPHIGKEQSTAAHEPQGKVSYRQVL